MVGAEDDSIDTDTGVKATLQYVVAVQRDEVGDGIIEADSNNGLEDQTPRQNTRIANATFIQRRTNDQAIRIRGGTDYALFNTLVIDASQGTPCLRIDLPETTRNADDGLDDVGPPRFESVNFDCDTGFRDGSGGVTAAQAQSIFEAGSNNSTDYSNTLTMTYLNGATEDALSPFDVTAISMFFDDADFVGAAQAGDTRFEGWTLRQRRHHLRQQFGIVHLAAGLLIGAHDTFCSGEGRRAAVGAHVLPRPTDVMIEGPFPWP